MLENETEAKTKLTDAVEQIKSRDYGNTEPKKAELLRIATVFNADPKGKSFYRVSKSRIASFNILAKALICMVKM